MKENQVADGERWKASKREQTHHYYFLKLQPMLTTRLKFVDYRSPLPKQEFHQESMVGFIFSTKAEYLSNSTWTLSELLGSYGFSFARDTRQA
ncbi:hypothetical protein WI229_03375 [Salmonella enterica subsp. enterica serovar Infantis]